ncbi:hypothetical protein Patl1_05514 [Pistacia atlantica]|uniref:Uncharacterized protein n=1 Tax=Pistacia atlantica TaxID=434234 RepID=A0ACC1BWA4_9ROSI|nr:hypothetical protein Patl1_05514 [Pistacia atlantica]
MQNSLRNCVNFDGKNWCSNLCLAKDVLDFLELEQRTTVAPVDGFKPFHIVVLLILSLNLCVAMQVYIIFRFDPLIIKRFLQLARVEEISQTIDSLIGEGSYGRVYFGVLRSGQSTTIKKLDSSKQLDLEFLAPFDGPLRVLVYSLLLKDLFMTFFMVTPKLSEDKVKQCVDAELNGEYSPKAVVCVFSISAIQLLTTFEASSSSSKNLSDECQLHQLSPKDYRYSSGKWSKFEVLCPRKLKTWLRKDDAFVFNKTLHWLDSIDAFAIVAYHLAVNQ